MLRINLGLKRRILMKWRSMLGMRIRLLIMILRLMFLKGLRIK